MFHKLYLVLKELAGGKFISFIVFCVILLSVSAILAFNVLSDNFNNYIKNNFASSIPPDIIKVKQGESKSIFMFSTGTGRELNAEAVKKISRINGVKKVDPVLAVTVPSAATLYIFSFQYRSDIICAGASYDFIADDLKLKEMKEAWLKGTHPKGIPILVPKTLIDSYNNGLAAANGLPEIIPDKLTTHKFKATFGRSSVSSLDGAYDTSVVVAGNTNKINITGFVIPLKVAQEINKKFEKGGRYMFLIVKVKDHKNADYVKDHIKKMGFTIETGESLSAEILKLKRTVNAFIALMVVLVSTLAAVATGLSSVTAVWGRIEYYRIMRTLGASKLFIAFTILVKFAVMGFLASACGIWGITLLRDYILKSIMIPGVKLSIVVNPALAMTVLTAGTLIPVAASLPAIIRMFAVKLDRS